MLIRKIKLLKGQIHSYFSNGKNPCGCGSNLYHLELEVDNKIIYGVCNACKKDIYIIDEDIKFNEWRYK